MNIQKNIENIDASGVEKVEQYKKNTQEDTNRTVIGQSRDTIKEIKNIYFILFNKYKSDDAKNFSNYMKSCSLAKRDEMFAELPIEYQMKLLSNL